MPPATLDELYFTWLYSQVADLSDKNPNRTYVELLKQMYRKEFVWIVPNDDNRIQDGLDLRREFYQVHDISEIDAVWEILGCSVLEMLVALSRALSFEVEREPRAWFWEMMGNLGVGLCTDRKWKRYSAMIDPILETLIWRTYHFDGSGGLFPLQRPEQDQRKVEIWYQLQAFLLERGYY